MFGTALLLAAAMQVGQPQPPIVVTPWPPHAPPAPPPIVISPPLPPAPPSSINVSRPPRPRGSILALFSMEDYPAAAMEAREQGVVWVTAMVNVDGRVSQCHVEESSGSSRLDLVTCRILQRRARFIPATDSAGSPVPSRFRQRVRWELEALPFESFTRTTRIARGPGETMQRCSGGADCDDSDF